MNKQAMNIIRIFLGGYIVFIGICLLAQVTEQNPSNRILLSAVASILVLAGAVSVIYSCRKLWLILHPEEKKKRKKEGAAAGKRRKRTAARRKRVKPTAVSSPARSDGSEKEEPLSGHNDDIPEEDKKEDREKQPESDHDDRLSEQKDQPDHDGKKDGAGDQPTDKDQPADKDEPADKNEAAEELKSDDEEI